jgi:hypothetical protein
MRLAIRLDMDPGMDLGMDQVMDRDMDRDTRAHKGPVMRQRMDHLMGQLRQVRTTPGTRQHTGRRPARGMGCAENAENVEIMAQVDMRKGRRAQRATSAACHQGLCSPHR